MNLLHFNLYFNIRKIILKFFKSIFFHISRIFPNTYNVCDISISIIWYFYIEAIQKFLTCLN